MWPTSPAAAGCTAPLLPPRRRPPQAGLVLRNVRLTAELADHWNYGLHLASETAAMIPKVNDACRAAGRDPATARLLSLLNKGALDQNQTQAVARLLIAAQIDPHRSTASVLADLRGDHPPADQLLQTFRDTLGGLRQFIEQKKIITLP